MNTLLLVRHAKSDWSNDELTDFERPLNERGVHDASAMAAFVKGQGIEPTYIMSSPANRAYTTARAFAAVMGIAENDIGLREDLYEATTAQVLASLADLPDAHQVVAVFGHNPSMTSAVAQFSGEYISNVPTCGVAVCKSPKCSWANFAPRNADLVNLWLPKEVLSAYA